MISYHHAILNFFISVGRIFLLIFYFYLFFSTTLPTSLFMSDIDLICLKYLGFICYFHRLTMVFVAFKASLLIKTHIAVLDLLGPSNCCLLGSSYYGSCLL